MGGNVEEPTHPAERTKDRDEKKNAARTSASQRKLRRAVAALGSLLVALGFWSLVALSGRPQALLSAFIAIGFVAVLMSVLRFQRKQLTIEFILAVIGALAVPYTVWNLGAQGTVPSHLSIDHVLFYHHNNGQETLVVSGIYHERAGDGYLFAVARPSRIPYGTADWLVSEPVTPDRDGHWTASITLTPADSYQKMTVFAVLAGGCPPGTACGSDPEAIRQEIESQGPRSAGYATPSQLTPAAPAIRAEGPALGALPVLSRQRAAAHPRAA